MDSNKFFEDFILKYPIYQDNRIFRILVTKFKEIFVKDVYDDIPQIFKKLYENGEIPEDVYDYFLVDIGVSQDLIDTLSSQEKLIFIKSLADFQKYKSTVGLIQNVVKAYGNSAEVYELYVDYNLIQGRWDCKPYLVYKPEHSDGYNKTIPYRTVYEKIPSLLIHETQLDRMRADKLAIFPIKTNVLFVTSNYNQSVTSYLQNLIISVFYNHYHDQEISLYFEDKLITCNLHQFVLTWLYLVFNKNNSCNIDCILNGLYINFDRTFLAENITINDLDGIIDEYEAITGHIADRSCRSNELLTTDLDDFYFKYINPQKKQISPKDNILDVKKIKNWLKTENPILIKYIDDKLTNISPTTISLLFNDLILSIEAFKTTTTDVNFSKYFHYFKTFLPTVDLLPIQNTVYKILYYTKPFHTELLDLADLSMVISQDTFNNIYFNQFYHNVLFFEHPDIIETETFQQPLMLKKTTESTSIVSHLDTFRVRIPYTIDCGVEDDVIFLYSS